MNEFREVTIQWNDDPQENQYSVKVGVGVTWNEREDDDNVFFYFDTEQDFQEAKKFHKYQEFTIMEDN
tara:strand:- start:177 stop:380 length:204 start_codon:yes stop_codon:yes gene_type:complete